MTEHERVMVFLAAFVGFVWMMLAWFATQQIILTVIIFMLTFSASWWFLGVVTGGKLDG
jgi:hypothetical protein